MSEVSGGFRALKPVLSKTWVQWTLATVFFLLLSFLYMGHAVTQCSTSTVALNSDSSGGLAWFQWAGGNDLSWGYSYKTNFPAGESLARPQFITSEIFIFVYKIMASISTPICGLNLMVLLGYMSTGLMMFGLMKWLFKRFDIAIFAGFAAAFVPYHQLKAQSHIVYVFGSIFIGLIWSYLWFMSRPSYRRAAVLGLVSSIGFYFDGYYVLISAILIACLYSSSFLFDLYKIVDQKKRRKIAHEALARLRYLCLSIGILFVLLLPIIHVQMTQGDTLKRSFAAARGDIKIETIEYGARPIEFVVPSFNNPILPTSYQNWRLSAKQQHYSNPSENTLYVGYTVLILAVLAVAFMFKKRERRLAFRNISYRRLVLTLLLPLVALVLFSMPSRFSLLGHLAYMPTRVLIKLTSNWRVMARLFLAIDPILIVLASLGLYAVTKNWKKIWSGLLILLCTTILFFEYLPPNFSLAGDLYKDSPAIYKRLAADSTVKTVAEYPITDFRYSPTIFTFQQMDNKTLLNSNDASIARGPFDTGISGLNDVQTIGALKALGIDVVTSYGLNPRNDKLAVYYPASDNNKGGIPTIYSYRISSSVMPESYVLLAEDGFDYFSVDNNLISHRVLVKDGTLIVQPLGKAPALNFYAVGFDAQSICAAGASTHLKISQNGKVYWEGDITNAIQRINFTTPKGIINLSTTCAIDITNMHASQAIY